MNGRWHRGWWVIGGLVLVPALVSEGVAADRDLTLRRIMQDLGAEMEVIAAAISREQWVRVAEAAPRVADHPQPPLSEKVRILSRLGTDAARFRGYDRQVHEAAGALAEAAQGEDGLAVIAAFAQLQRTCLACHQSFRRHFHARRDGD